MKARAVQLLPAALVAALLGLPQSAFAQEQDSLTYVFEIDCAHRGILNEGTRSAIELVGVSDNGEEHSFIGEEENTTPLTDADCLAGVVAFDVSVPFGPENRISVVRLDLLNGQYADDALFLDSLTLTLIAPDFEDVIAWDEDGKDGWCLSVDPDDGRRDWGRIVYEDMCFPCMEFSVIAESEDSPVVDGDWRHTAVPGYSECAVSDEENPPGG